MKIIFIALVSCVHFAIAQLRAEPQDLPSEEVKKAHIKLINDMLLCKKALLSKNGTAVSQNASDIAAIHSDDKVEPLFTFERYCNINNQKESDPQEQKQNRFEIYSLGKNADGSFFIGQADSILQGSCMSFGLTPIVAPFRFSDQNNQSTCKQAEIGVWFPVAIKNQSSNSCASPETHPIQLGTKKVSKLLSIFYNEFKKDFAALSRDEHEIRSNKYKYLFEHPNINNCESLANTNALPDYLSSYSENAKATFAKIKSLQQTKSGSTQIQSQPETSAAPGQR